VSVKRGMREQLFRMKQRICITKESVTEYIVEMLVNSKRTRTLFSKRHRARTGFYIDYLSFMSESRVLECMFCKLDELERWRGCFCKPSFNARTRFVSPPAFND